MNLAVFLILFPLIPAVILLGAKESYYLQKWVTLIAAVVIIVAVVLFAIGHIHIGSEMPAMLTLSPNRLIMIGDIVLACVFLFICRKLPLKYYWIPTMVILQYGAVLYCEFAGFIPETTYYLFLDSLSAIMSLVIGVIGSLIAVYAVDYMKHYHEVHQSINNKSHLFLAAVFLFFFAMFGIVLSNSLTWMYFFWEITTLCSFLMISYSGTPQALENAFRALWMLLLGGLAFAGAIIYLSFTVGTIELHQVMTMKKALVMFPVLLLCFAGMNKAALYPFGSWLLGAMAAPTPSSALLHSSTMVKAGVYIVLRFAPILHHTDSGAMVALIGGFSFLAGSALAISQRDGKRILAYSTIANLGMIILCAGIGTSFTMWAAVLVIIFHAVAKALLFLGVGTVDQQTQNKDVDNMHGLICRMPLTTIVMVIGLAGMFLAPFGMLISKWAVIEALTQTNAVFAAIVVFGGSMMLFFWVKWMGKLIAVTKERQSLESGIGLEWIALWGLAGLVIVTCICYPIIGKWWLLPLYGPNPMLYTNIEMSIAVLLALALLPVFFVLIRWRRLVFVQPYLGGVNVEEAGKFIGSLGVPRKWTFSNYYLANFFGEQVLTKSVVGISTILWVLMFLMERVST
jgi:ech hydrogenase subunit A